MSESRKTIQKRADAKRAGTRARAWTCLVYPDSAPDDWQDIIREQLIECLISPLHDKDVWTDTDELENPEHKAGTPKKAHWHVVLSFKNPATSEKAQEIFATVNGVGCKKVKDFKQMARYLATWISLKSIVTLWTMLCRLVLLTIHPLSSAEPTKTNCLTKFLILLTSTALEGSVISSTLFVSKNPNGAGLFIGNFTV